MHMERESMREKPTMPDGQQIHRTIPAMALRRQRPGTGSAVVFLRTRTQHMRFPDLTTVLHGVLWAVVGDAATRLYMPECLTQDVESLMTLGQLEMGHAPPDDLPV